MKRTDDEHEKFAASIMAKHKHSDRELAAQQKDPEKTFDALFPLVPAQGLTVKQMEALEEKLLFVSNVAVVNAQPDSVNKAEVSNSDRLTDHDKEEKYRMDLVIEAENRQGARERFEQLKGLKEKLAKRNMKVGGVIGMGSMGVAYELETLDGKKVPSAILRIDPKETVGQVDNPASAKILFHEENGYYSASIVAKAEAIDTSKMTMEERYAKVQESLSVFNAVKTGQKRWDDDIRKDVKLPDITHIDYLKDLASGQFMKMPGVDVWQLTDISSVHNEPLKESVRDKHSGEMVGGHGLQNIDEFIRNYDQPESIRTAVAPPELVANMRKQVDALNDRVTKEIKAVGIDITPPTVQTDATATGVGQEKKNARA
ncbi:MAG: hypothetical protein K2Q01_02010 [Rickettsiales bacterium]|nr:hypothetical protein [Rickettsiales bacterium]